MARKSEALFVAIEAELMAEYLRENHGSFNKNHGGGDAQEAFIRGVMCGVKWQKLRAKIRNHEKRRTTAASQNL